MTTYTLLGPGDTVTGAAAPALHVRPHGPENPNSPPQNQAFVLTATSTAGAVTAVAQVMASNDEVNWVNYGTTLSATGTVTGSAGAVGNAPYRYFGAVLNSITGTNAGVVLIMSA
jgi:hypothetical protein